MKCDRWVEVGAGRCGRCDGFITSRWQPHECSRENEHVEPCPICGAVLKADGEGWICPPKATYFQCNNHFDKYLRWNGKGTQ